MSRKDAEKNCNKEIDSVELDIDIKDDESPKIGLLVTIAFKD